MIKNTRNWFESWFNSPYYHILYRHRDESEAQFFIDHLLNYFSPGSDSKILDLACGKGRHSVYMSEKGYDVTGLDLASDSIREAKKYEKERLHFDVHDMRNIYKKEYFDYIFNFFTSFGYFEDESDNIRMLKAIENELKPGGSCVIDFFNINYIKEHLHPEEVKEIDGIRFEITRGFENGFVRKDIIIDDKGKKARFFERVQAIGAEDFKGYFKQTGLKIRKFFGSYDLIPFDPDRSPRLIIIADKK